MSPEHYVECTDLELLSECGRRARFVGRRVAQDRPCRTCGTDATVSVYQGPQHGLAFDEPVNPFEVAPVELQLAWCSRHGDAGFQLVRQDGSAYDGL